MTDNRHQNDIDLDNYQKRLEEKKSKFIEGLAKTSPVPCDFTIGDLVTFTNEYGLSFENREILGFDSELEGDNRFIYFDSSSYWYPANPGSLTHKNTWDAFTDEQREARVDEVCNNKGPDLGY